jgi:hypothetical protein
VLTPQGIAIYGKPWTRKDEVDPSLLLLREVRLDPHEMLVCN